MKRLRPSGILPLELWDLLMPDGSILWHHMQSPDFGERLHTVISQVWHGEAATQSEGKVSESIRGFHTLHLTGGGAPSVYEKVQRGPWSATTLSLETTFGSATGGRALLAERGLDGWVLDVGQSGFKISDASVRLQKPRDWNRLPLRDGLTSADIPNQRAELRHSLAKLLMEMHEAVGEWPRSIIAGLPSRLDDQGVPEDCSYIGMKGDSALIPDAMQLAGMPDVPLFVLNDAELAAVSAQHEFALMKPALLLTLGFGVGGAMIHTL
ncbi:MAG: hypothetical protein V4662_19620 [Verrucomicrobiota bacterium]